MGDSEDIGEGERGSCAVVGASKGEVEVERWHDVTVEANLFAGNVTRRKDSKLLLFISSDFIELRLNFFENPCAFSQRNIHTPIFQLMLFRVGLI